MSEDGKRTNLGSLPHGLGVLAVLLNERKDAAGDDPVGFTEVVVDLFTAGRRTMSAAAV